jgi:hypothetical protein
MKMQGTLRFLLAKEKIAGHDSKVKENIRYGNKNGAIPIIF